MEVQPFTIEDIPTILDDQITDYEKLMTYGGYLWLSVNQEFLERWVGEADNECFKVVHNGETVAKFAYWNRVDDYDPDKYVRISNVYLLKAYRNSRFENKPFAQWVAELTIEKAKEIYPNKKLMGLVYDFTNSPFPKGHKYEPVVPRGLSSFILAGYKKVGTTAGKVPIVHHLEST